MTTLQAAIDSLRQERHKKKVLEAALNHLHDHVEHEGVEASLDIQTDGGTTVPQSSILEVIDLIEEELVAPLDTNIKRLERMEVVDGQEESGAKGTKPAGRKTAAKRKGTTRTTGNSKRSSKKSAATIRLGRKSKARSAD